MEKYVVTITANTTYEVVAENEDEAIDRAMGWFEDYMPEVYVEKIIYGN